MTRAGSVGGSRGRLTASSGRVGCGSLYIAVIVRAVGLRHVHFAHGVSHVVDRVTPRRHALVDAVQPLRLLEAGDLVLCKSTDCRPHGRRARTGERSLVPHMPQSQKYNWGCTLNYTTEPLLKRCSISHQLRYKCPS